MAILSIKKRAQTVEMIRAGVLPSDKYVTHHYKSCNLFTICYKVQILTETCFFYQSNWSLPFFKVDRFFKTGDISLLRLFGKNSYQPELLQSLQPNLRELMRVVR